jgi:4-alpha-glucanotransferase
MLINRKSGVLCHISSLASPFGVGDLGPYAYEFVDFLHNAGQRLWQILPLNPTQSEFGDSPYSSISAFAGNTLFISPSVLAREGLLTEEDIKTPSVFSAGSVDHSQVRYYKNELFKKTFKRTSKKLGEDFSFDFFCESNDFWLDDYALFVVLNGHFKGKIWNGWPPVIRDRNKDALQDFENKYKEEILEIKYLQYLFFKQWFQLRQYCNQKKIQIIGDLPLYINFHSADVWAHPEFFKLDRHKKPLVVAGVPPDYFSEDGQLWNNPIYSWDTLKMSGYEWWIKRMEHNFKIFDWIRLDHFRGFVDYWEVPAGEATARNGLWKMGPGDDLFNTLIDYFPQLPIITEDLGDINPGVRELRDRFGFPGMRILQFAFGGDKSSLVHKPHNYINNCVAYTGTHDNNTITGWFSEGIETKNIKKKKLSRVVDSERRLALEYAGVKDTELTELKETHWEFLRVLMASPASYVIFPLQDILGLGEKARMNTPGTTKGNWQWRLSGPRIKENIVKKLKKLTEIYDRS